VSLRPATLAEQLDTARRGLEAIGRIPDPDPGPYRGFMVDATILATINEATKHITDAGVRKSLESGVAAGLKSMQTKAGEDVSISLEAPRG